MLSMVRCTVRMAQRIRAKRPDDYRLNGIGATRAMSGTALACKFVQFPQIEHE